MQETRPVVHRDLHCMCYFRSRGGSMIKSILAISEGGPDAALSFRLAARIAGLFEATVDAVHFSEARRHELDITRQSMPFLARVSDERISEHAIESRRAFDELLAGLPGATFTGDETVTLERIVALGRLADLLVIGRPGVAADAADAIAPATVRAAIYESARPVVVAPPYLKTTGIDRVVVAWNGSQQAARAVSSALPFLRRAEKVAIVVAGGTTGAHDPAPLLRMLGRHDVEATVSTLEHEDTSGRARGRALIERATMLSADMLVMGAYGHGGLTNFLGLGGATAQVIATCPVPLLLAH